jgi:hypothetical protein
MAKFNIHEWRNNHLYEDPQVLLKEDLWSKVKKGLSKIGTLTKGGTWDPWKGKKLKGKAEKEIGDLIDKGSESVIADLDSEIKEKYPEFPNMESNEDFTQGLEVIAAHYDTIANAIEQGDLEQESGNYIIWDLRKYIDYDLASIYRVFTEAEEDEEDVLKGGRYSKTHGVFKSNKLPLSLALMGLSTYGLALIAQSDWLANLLGSGEELDIAEEAEAVFGNIQPGEGMTQIMSRLFDNIDLDPSSTGAEFTEAVESIGGVDALEGIFSDPVAGTQAVEAIMSNPDLAGAPLSDIFVAEWAGTGEQMGDMLVTKPGGTLAGTVVNIVTTMVAKQSVKAVAVAAFGNSVLAPLGLSLAAAGATVKAARMKGLSSSRLSAMEDVLFRMKFINAENPEPPNDCIITYFETKIVISTISQIILNPTKVEIRFEDYDLEKNIHLNKESTVQLDEETQIIESITMMISCLDGTDITINSIEEYWERRTEILSILEEHIIVIVNEEDPEPGPEPDLEPGPEPEPKPLPKPEPVQMQDFSTGIREAQITMIMGLINPDIPIFSYINQMKEKGDENKMLDGVTYVQSDWVKLAKESPSSEVQELAKVIINARKSPDTWTKKIGNILGIEFGKRAKSQMLQPGKAGQGAELVGLSPLKEIHLFNEMLYEALIDQYLDETNIKANAGQILAFIGSMYASKDDITIGILNSDELPEDLKKEIENLGFTPSTSGREAGIYVFTEPGDTGLHVEPLDSEDEEAFKQGKIFVLQGDEYPEGIEKTDFYKKAYKDGWRFKISKDLKGKEGNYKSISAPFDMVWAYLNKLNYNDLKAKGDLEPQKE